MFLVTGMTRRSLIGIAVALALALAFPLAAFANVPLTTISTDPYTNTTSFHATEVEPDTFSFGSTIVASFQAGRFQDGGASNIGWATSTNGGTSWVNGFMPGLTVFSTPAGPYDRSTDPSVAYDARHNVWMVSSLPLKQKRNGISGVAVVVNRSTDGGLTWGNPVTVKAAGGGQDFDKNWTACDNSPTSPFYGNCYTQWDDFGHSNQLHMSTSSDGGLTWKQGSVPARQTVIGGQPVVQPNGTVVVPIDNGFETAIESFVSTNGGASYSGPFSISTISSHGTAGGLRSGPLPTAEIDGTGKVYVVWADCRFETQCRANDLVISTSTNGTTWTTPALIPVDAVGSGVDHFIPGLAVDSTGHLGLTYYYYPNTSCTTSTCQLDVGFISSPDGGANWSVPTQLAGPITLTWLPNTSQGYMVGDYISTSFSGSVAFGVFENATAGNCTLGNATSCNEFSVAPSSGLTAAPATGGLTPLGTELPVPNAASDHAAPQSAVKTH